MLLPSQATSMVEWSSICKHLNKDMKDLIAINFPISKFDKQKMD